MSNEVVKSNHFEGGKNLSKGGSQGAESDLASVVNSVARTYDSDPSAGGGATESLTVTGLKASDKILAVQVKTKGANAVGVAGWSNQGADALDVDFTADPGVGAVVQVLAQRQK